MKPLFWVGIVVLVLGIASLFVALPHRETHGVSVGDASVGVQTKHNEKVSPAISAVLIVVGGVMMLGGRGGRAVK
jgi:hypothetical protein